jgi:acetolactate synthase-1/2/3 large subunit
VGIGLNPKLAARIKDSDLILAIGPRLGEMTTGGYTLLQAPSPSRSWSTSTRAPKSSTGLPGRPGDQRDDERRRPSPRGAHGAAEVPWGAWTKRHADYEANLVPQSLARRDRHAGHRRLLQEAPAR